jgi:hypothetical protein
MSPFRRSRHSRIMNWESPTREGGGSPAIPGRGAGVVEAYPNAESKWPGKRPEKEFSLTS